jgi:hypothetical protein
MAIGLEPRMLGTVGNNEQEKMRKEEIVPLIFRIRQLLPSRTKERHKKTLNQYFRVRVTLRLAVYRQSVRLGDKHFEAHDQNVYFPNEHLQLESLCNILCDEDGSVVYNCCWPSQSSYS